MELTRDVRDAMRERARRDPKFREALLREAGELQEAGDEETAERLIAAAAPEDIPKPKSA